ncbi:MAG: hypothetical protein IJ083_09570 [Clostridia bacterium]|nr:hypothetical protein [Clostridia bacterium]
MRRTLPAVICLILAMLCLCFATALSEEQKGLPLSLSEIQDFAQACLTRARDAELLNDPTDPESFTPDGYAFVYDFAVLYFDRPVWEASSELKGILLQSEEVDDPRGLVCPASLQSVLDAYLLTNDALDGSRTQAVLYNLDSLPSYASWGMLNRDGQRLNTVQYSVHELMDDGLYSDCGLLYTFTDGYVSAIRLFGLDTRTDATSVRATMDWVRSVDAQTGYVQVPTSSIGTDLLPFDMDDLLFSGLDFVTCTPSSAQHLFGAPLQDDWMEDDDGSFLETVDFDGLEMTFQYDTARSNPYLTSLTLLADDLEGPRAIRIGDSFSSVFTRFRYGEQGWSGEGPEILYGNVDEVPYAMAEYTMDAGATLRYVTSDPEGHEIVLFCIFENMTLTEMILYRL